MKKQIIISLISAVLLGTLLGIVGMTAITGASGNSNSNSALDISSVENSNFIVKTDENGALPTLSKEQLIKACDSLSGEQKSNALSFVNAVKSAEDKYKVNAVFSLSVFRKENGLATNKSGILGHGTYNIGSLKGSYNGNSYGEWRKYNNYDEAIMDYADNIANGSYYFKAGKYTLKEIGTVYCNPPDEWIKIVKEYIMDFYKSAGVEVATTPNKDVGNGASSGKGETVKDQIGYTSTYSVGGKTFKEWKQYPLDGTSGSGWAGWLKTSGCGLTSAAIVLGGKNEQITPYYLYSYKNGREKTGEVKITTYITDAGAKYSVAKNKEQVKSGLLKGKQVIACLGANASLNGEKWAGPSGHYIALLDISKDGKKVYVSNPGANPTHKNGWVNLDSLNTMISYESGHVYVIDL